MRERERERGREGARTHFSLDGSFRKTSGAIHSGYNTIFKSQKEDIQKKAHGSVNIYNKIVFNM
jgi:hypothetical protein